MGLRNYYYKIEELRRRIRRLELEENRTRRNLFNSQNELNRLVQQIGRFGK